jgi:hypothetical protein
MSTVLPLEPRKSKEMADQIRGNKRYATNSAPSVPAITVGSEVDMVSMVDEAIGLAPSIAWVVCCAASALSKIKYYTRIRLITYLSLQISSKLSKR